MKLIGNNCIAALSGGPTAVINSSLCGVVQRAMESKEIGGVYAAVNGVEGLIGGKIIDIDREDKREIELLKYTPSAAIGSCRHKLKDYTKDESEYIKIFEMLERLKIGYFFYIGGNDSMDTTHKLSIYAKNKGIPVKIIGIPKTIDNDLMGTDHTPGFGSAAKYIAATISEVSRDGDSYNKDVINVIEVMGRDSGFLALSSALAGKDICGAPDLIYLPEVEFNLEKFLKDVEGAYRRKGKITIVVSEGIKTKGRYVCELLGERCRDSFGHAQMGGTAKFLADEIKNKICSRVKALEFGVLQRSASHYASMTDINEAYNCGKMGVEWAIKGETGKMVSMQRVSNNPYKIEYKLVDAEVAANNVKLVPREWINEEGNNVNSKAIEYVKPLVSGYVPVPEEDGIPRYSRLKMEYVNL